MEVLKHSVLGVQEVLVAIGRDRQIRFEGFGDASERVHRPFGLSPVLVARDTHSSCLGVRVVEVLQFNAGPSRVGLLALCLHLVNL